MTGAPEPEVQPVQHYLARLFPAGGRLAGEVLLWGDSVIGPPLAILSFWPGGVAIPASGRLPDGRWHLEFGIADWERILALLRDAGQVMFVIVAGEPHLSTTLEAAGGAGASSRLPRP